MFTRRSWTRPSGWYLRYQGRATTAQKVEKAIAKEGATTDSAKEAIRRREVARARRFGGFLGSWVETAKRTFRHVYIFGTDDVPGGGLRETFVVVASKRALSLGDLGDRLEDPVFRDDDGTRFKPRPYSKDHMAELDVRGRGIVLTDDYAPVENLLAPVAATRGEDDE